MKRWIPIFVAVGLCVPTVSTAQVNLDLRITPRAGVMTPADYFYEQFPHFGSPPLEWTEAFIYEAAVIGLAAELEIGDSGLWIRGEVMQTLDAILSMTYAVLIETNGFEPPRVERTPYRVATALTIGSLDLALPTRFTLGPVQPYVTLGVGGKRYSFVTEPFEELTQDIVLPQPGVVGAANLGGGAVVRLFGTHLDVQVRDAMSYYWGRLQHDVMVFAGLTWTIL